MASLRGNCIAACLQNNGSSCWHKDTIIRKQLTNGKWMLENKKGYIRLADEDMIIFDGGEYLKHKHTNLNNGNHMICEVGAVAEQWKSSVLELSITL